VSDVLAAGGPVMVFQAVHGIADRQVVGWEALARFPAGHGGPAQWFADAHRVGLGLDLEVAAVRQALASSPLLPGAGFLAVNLSAQTVLDADLAMLTEPAVAARVVVEITEHEQVADYVPLLERMAQLRDAGVRFAADDAGAGYAGLRHLVELRPDVIKMDRDLTHAMDRDPARIAMATTLASFALATGAVLIAEGIETRGELLAAARLGIPFGQGYHLSRPVSPADAGGSGEPGADGRPPVGTVTT
jgi:EAL domain-containing protein (putative c-di-GMP-specific phosphodiesterase class I)